MQDVITKAAFKDHITHILQKDNSNVSVEFVTQFNNYYNKQASLSKTIELIKMTVKNKDKNKA